MTYFIDAPEKLNTIIVIRPQDLNKICRIMMETTIIIIMKKQTFEVHVIKTISVYHSLGEPIYFDCA